MNGAVRVHKTNKVEKHGNKGKSLKQINIFKVNMKWKLPHDLLPYCDVKKCRMGLIGWLWFAIG